MTPHYLAQLTWEEARAAAGRDPIVLLPVGATEAHGPHLPLATDVYLAEELSLRAQAALLARGRPALIAPALCYAVTEFGAAFAGTVSIGAETARRLYADVCLGLQRGGFLRVCLVNSHLEPAHVAALRAAVAEVRERGGPPVAFPDHTEKRWARTLTDEYRSGRCHAGQYETSLLLAGRPELVREELLRGLSPNDSDFLGALRRGVGSFAAAGGPRAYFGDPAHASRAEGEQTYDLLVQMVVTVVEETWYGPSPHA